MINIVSITKVIRKIKKLGVCGASWACTDSRHPNTHFTELLAKHFDCDYLNLALPGCSNDVICLQIDYALNNQCDALIIQIEMPDRITFSFNEQKDFDFHMTNIKNKFCYRSHPLEGSDQNKGFISSNFRSIIDKTSLMHLNKITQDDYKNGMRKYMMYYYSEKKQAMIDSWIFSNFLKICISKSIMLCVLINTRNPILPNLKYLDENILKCKNNLPFSFDPVVADPLYHTDSATQQHVFEDAVNYFDKY